MEFLFRLEIRFAGILTFPQAKRSQLSCLHVYLFYALGPEALRDDNTLFDAHLPAQNRNTAAAATSRRLKPLNSRSRRSFRPRSLPSVAIRTTSTSRRLASSEAVRRTEVAPQPAPAHPARVLARVATRGQPSPRIGARPSRRPAPEKASRRRGCCC
jgi:hypothetical protein